MWTRTKTQEQSETKKSFVEHRILHPALCKSLSRSEVSDMSYHRIRASWHDLTKVPLDMSLRSIQVSAAQHSTAQESGSKA